MKSLYCRSCLIILLCYICGTAQAEELARRKDMSPLDRAKVQSSMSKRWLNYGATGGTRENRTTLSERSITNEVDKGLGGSSACITNIGTVQQNQGISSGRYGPSSNKDNIVVITGDLINVCK